LPRLLASIIVAVGLACAGGCNTASIGQRLTLPDRYTVSGTQLLLHTEFPLPQHHRVMEDLLAVRADAIAQLGLPQSDEAIHVYLFETPARFTAYMRLHYPDLPPRRAFFVETDSRLLVFAQWSDRMGEDLRHEVMHGYLHSVFRNLPLWLDEGLAEYYEPPRSRPGRNAEHIDRLALHLKQGSFQPDLQRLEQLGPQRDLTQDQYAEAWAWTHWLLQTKDDYRELLRGYLADLRTQPQPRPLSERLAAAGIEPERELMAHVRAMTEAR
jgi:hypothetical protein